MYREAFEKHGMSPSSVLMPKGRQDVRFASMCRHMRSSDFSVLDFGSGLGDLARYLHSHFGNVRYTGVDIVDEFVAAASKAYPADRFEKLVDFRNLAETFDYVVIAGVFNSLYSENEDTHKRYVFDVISHLFALTNDYMSLNFMTTAVDFKQAGAYHQNPVELCEFVSRHLSSRWILDQSYMPYEFTLTIFRDAEILRPENIYSVRK